MCLPTRLPHISPPSLRNWQTKINCPSIKQALCQKEPLLNLFPSKKLYRRRLAEPGKDTPNMPLWQDSVSPGRTSQEKEGPYSGGIFSPRISPPKDSAPEIPPWNLSGEMASPVWGGKVPPFPAGDFSEEAPPFKEFGTPEGVILPISPEDPEEGTFSGKGILGAFPSGPSPSIEEGIGGVPWKGVPIGGRLEEGTGGFCGFPKEDGP